MVSWGGGVSLAGADGIAETGMTGDALPEATFSDPSDGGKETGFGTVSLESSNDDAGFWVASCGDGDAWGAVAAGGGSGGVVIRCCLPLEARKDITMVRRMVKMRSLLFMVALP